MKKIGSKIRKLHIDNRGAGIATVLIVIGFLSMLVAGLLVTTYMGYSILLSDKQNKDNFYTAESILDEINVGIQGEISTALSEAYTQVMVNYALYGDSATRTAKFQQLYTDKLNTALQSATSSVYSLDKLRSFISSELKGDGDGSREHFVTYGAIIESGSGTCPLTVSLVDGILLEDVKLTYVNSRGYVSMLSTDICIAIPNIGFDQRASLPDIYKYSIIADSGLVVGNRISGRSVNIAGDVYASDMNLGKQTINVGADTYQLMQNVNINFSGSADPTSPYVNVVSKGDVQVHEATLKTAQVDLWSGNIVLNSGNAELNGNTYVANDIRLEKNPNTVQGSAVKLIGTYFGFGNGDANEDEHVTSDELAYADERSAIVVNGRNSSLDLSQLTSLGIGGNTYISTTSEVDLGASGEFEHSDTAQVYMGESVAVKSNQLVYMVPAEALGCVKNGASIGDSAFNSNPMTMSQYQEIIQLDANGNSKYVLLDATRSIRELGNRKLEDYITDPVTGNVMKPLVVTKNSSGTTLVYFYLQFPNQQLANKYFQDYYGVNAAQVDRFTHIFADAIKMPSNTNDMLYLHLAGNVLAYDAANKSVIEATDGVDEIDSAADTFLHRKKMFQTLTTKMESDYGSLTTDEVGFSVYGNLVNDEAWSYDGSGHKSGIMAELVDKLEANESDDYVRMTDGVQTAVISLGDYVIDNSAVNANVCLVVARGNVYVERSFNGTIVAGGQVIIFDGVAAGENVNVEILGMEEFNRALRISSTAPDGTEYYVANVFRASSGYTDEAATTAVDFAARIKIDDLVSYERWSKE